MSRQGFYLSGSSGIRAYTACPSQPLTYSQKYLAYPSISIVYALVGICSLVFAIITAVKYNFVEVYNVYVAV